MIIYGASGHGKVIADILLKNGCDKVIFVDYNISQVIESFEVLPPTAIPKKSEGIIGVGNNKIRKTLALKNPFPLQKRYTQLVLCL